LAATESGVVETVTTRTNERAAWQLVSSQDRFAILRNATEDTPVDATFLISGSDFGRNDTRNTAWKGSPTIGAANTDTAADHSNYCAEKRGTTFDVYQELTGLRNGDYMLSCQGFYTPDYNGSSTACNAHLYANEQDVPLMLIGTGGNAKPANSQSAACQAFSQGDYADNSVAVTVTDGTLRIGVRSTTSTGKDWTCFDHFRLTYLGAPSGTGIQSLTPTLSKGEETIYNLAGQMVKANSSNSKLPRGVYIVNGRKVVVK
jgi:hypothetical protein